MSLIVNYLLCAVMVSSIMNIVAKFRDNKLMFSNIFSITCYAATLPTILLSFIPMLFTNGMSFFIISMAGTIVYMFLIFKELGNENNKIGF